MLEISTRYSIIGKDLNGNVVSWNEGAHQNYGYTAEEMIGRSSELLHTPDDLASGVVDRLLATALETGVAEGRFLRVRKDGSWFTENVVVIRRENAKGRPTGYLLMGNDITEQLRAEAKAVQRTWELKQAIVQLRRSNEELEQFAYVASHDLSEPLRAISGPLSLVARRYQGKLDDETNEFIGFAVDGCRRMQQMIDDLLSYSRVSHGEASLRPVDCAAVVHGVLVELAPAIDEMRAEVAVGDLPTVVADPSLMTEVFRNLISNALKFVGPDVRPEISVTAERRGKKWRFMVADNGVGIKPPISRTNLRNVQTAPRPTGLCRFRNRPGHLQESCGTPGRPYRSRGRALRRRKQVLVHDSR